MPGHSRSSYVKAAFHDTDTYPARIVARMSACRVGRLPRSACHRNNFGKSRVSDVSARILARMSMSWNAAFTCSLTKTKLRVNRSEEILRII